MTDEELIEQAQGLPIFYFDGFGAYRKLNGVMRCVGFTLDLGATANLIVSLVGAEQANRDTRKALDAKPATIVSAWGDGAIAH